MTQAKKDQQSVDAVVEAMARQYGPKRVILALHLFALKQSNQSTEQPSHCPWNKLTGLFEALDYDLGHVDFPAPR